MVLLKRADEVAASGKESRWSLVCILEALGFFTPVRDIGSENKRNTCPEKCETESGEDGVQLQVKSEAMFAAQALIQ
jgi:hypothetical protein